MQVTEIGGCWLNVVRGAFLLVFGPAFSLAFMLLMMALSLVVNTPSILSSKSTLSNSGVDFMWSPSPQTLFAELKNRIGLRRLRLRRLRFVREQFFLAAVAQNIKRLVRFLTQPTTPLLPATT
jgi:hypothetical protein